jgi:branched-chain amino acid transport system permease protein
MYAGYSESWNIVCGYTGYGSMGHGALFGLSAYLVALLWHYFGLSPLVTPFLGGLAAAGFAAVIGYPTMRLRGYYFSLATLSLPMISQAVILGIPSITLGGFGVSNVYALEIPFELRSQAYYSIFLVYMVACGLIAYKLERSRFGVGLVAIRENEDAAVACGVNSTRLKTTAFMISGFLTGVGGGFFSSYLTYISPDSVLGLLMSVSPVLMVILGGRGVWLGPIIGAFSLDLARQYVAYNVLSVLNTAIFGAILIVIMLLAPGGMFGLLTKRGMLRSVRRKKGS